MKVLVPFNGSLTVPLMLHYDRCQLMFRNVVFFRRLAPIERTIAFHVLLEWGFTRQQCTSFRPGHQLYIFADLSYTMRTSIFYFEVLRHAMCNLCVVLLSHTLNICLNIEVFYGVQT